MKAVKCEEILLTTENKVGKLAQVAAAMKGQGVNIRAVSAWGVKDQAMFRLITSDNAKAKQALAQFGKVETKEVVMLEMPDKVGELASMAARLKEANIDLTYIYGTTSEPNQSAHIVFSSDDNDKALKAISS